MSIAESTHKHLSNNIWNKNLHRFVDGKPFFLLFLLYYMFVSDLELHDFGCLILLIMYLKIHVNVNRTPRKSSQPLNYFKWNTFNAQYLYFLQSIWSNMCKHHFSKNRQIFAPNYHSHNFVSWKNLQANDDQSYDTKQYFLS